MGRRGIIGELEERVLMTVLALGDNAYGVTIQERLAEVTGQPISFSAVYTTLDRMEKKGFVSSSLGESTPERGGRQKKFFRVEATGQKALAEAEDVRKRMRAMAGDGRWMPDGGAV